MPDKNSVLALIVDLKCHKCSKIIKKALSKLQDQGAGIEKIVYNEKDNTVHIYGTFNPECLKKQLCRSKACKVIKRVILPPPIPPPRTLSPPPPPIPTPTPPPKIPEWPFPFVFPFMPSFPACCYKPCPCYQPHHNCYRCCSCGHTFSNPEPPPPPPPPPPQRKLPEWPSFMPMFPVCCHKPCPCYQPHHDCCRCCSCGHTFSNPEPAPNPMPHCRTPAGHCEVYKIVCQEEPYYPCSIM